jgi:4-diphosphocytidyl-2-C-methyl-D-erythritol kinase
VAGENLAARAVDAFRAAANGADLGPVTITIDKRIPVAAGLGGGSADAAAVLRAANRLAGSPLAAGELRDVGVALGSDVPSQVEPAHALVTGTGERVENVELAPATLVLVPDEEGLSTAEVYAELDRLRAAGELPPPGELDPATLRRLAGKPAAELAAGTDNDLEAVALRMRPRLERTLASLSGAGALAARVTGSGPTAFGLFTDHGRAAAAAAAIPGAILTSLR